MMKDKSNFLIAGALCFAIIFGYETFLKPKDTPPQEQETTRSVAEKKEPSQGKSEAVGPEPFLSVEAALAQERIHIESEKVKGSIRLKGAFLDHWSFKDYKGEGEQNVALLNPYETEKSYYVAFRWECQDPLMDLPNHETVWQADQPHLSVGQPLVLSWKNKQGIVFRQELVLDKDYMLTVKQSVSNFSPKPMNIKAYGMISRQGPVPEGQFLCYEGPLGVVGGVLKNVPYKDIAKDPTFSINPQSWFGFTDKYWLTALIPNQDSKVNLFMSGAQASVFATKMAQEVTVIKENKTHTVMYHVFLGPKQLRLLDRYEQDLNIKRFDLALDFGWFYFLTKPMFYLLSFLKEVLGNFGLAILVMTVGVRLLFIPLSIRSARSMKKIKKIQPIIAELKERHKEDRVAMSHAMMTLYRKENIHPLSSIWPILLQFPIFFALYKVLFISIEMWNAPFYGWIKNLAAADPTNIFNAFGLLNIQLPSSLHVGAWPLLMGVSMVLQQKCNTAVSVTMDSVQNAMFTYIIPLFFAYMMAQLPSGMIIYWTWNNLLSIIQQILIDKFKLIDQNV